MKLDLGGLTTVIEHYPGHSGTDMIVRVADQNVVYAGDLLFNGIFPVTFDAQATVSGWRSTLKTFASWDKDTLFVPGHGQLCGQEGVAMLRSAFDDIEEQAMKLYKAGVPVEEAQHQYVCAGEIFETIHVYLGIFNRPDYPKDVQGMGREEVNLKTDESASTTRRYHFHQPRSATKTSVFAARRLDRDGRVRARRRASLRE